MNHLFKGRSYQPAESDEIDILFNSCVYYLFCRNYYAKVQDLIIIA